MPVQPHVSDRPDQHRFEMEVDGEPAGFASYRTEGPVVVFTHTEVDDAYEGQGVGSELVRRSLDAVRAQGRKVRAVCPFYASWIDRHPEYQDLVESAPGG